MNPNATKSNQESELPKPIEEAVRERYAAGAEQFEPGLCCPEAKYDSQFLAAIPDEILQKDYGCGDPSIHAEPGDTVIDLGSGGGKVCYILSQKVGASGRVIGIDFNDAMLELARRYQQEVADRIGYANVEFHKARIQDLAWDLERTAEWLTRNPITDVEALDRFHAFCEEQRRQSPLIADNSIDLIVSNCVLNLVNEEEKPSIFREMHRVLRPGGRVVISDIVSDEDVPAAMRGDAHLWSGCIAGAFREDAFLEAFERAGFGGIEIVKRQDEPWQVVEGIEFRSMTIRAWKLEQGPCLERRQAIVYRGPWKSVVDDDGHRFERGKRMAVCDKTYRLLTDPAAPYAEQVIGIESAESIPLEQAPLFDCEKTRYRPASETKKGDTHEGTRTNVAPTSCCGETGCC